MRSKLPWSKREEAFLRKNNHLPRKDLLAAFHAKFGRRDVKLHNLKNHLERMRLLHPATAFRRKVKVRPEEVDFIRLHHRQKRNFILRALAAKFGSTELTVKDIAALCHRHGWLSEYKGNNMPVGYEYFHKKDGRIVVRIPRLNPLQARHRNYAYKHRVLWEEICGPVPKGNVVLPVNGDWFDFDPLNWLAVPNGIGTRLYRSGFFEAPPELKSTILATAKLKHAIAHRGKRRSPQSSG